MGGVSEDRTDGVGVISLPIRKVGKTADVSFIIESLLRGNLTITKARTWPVAKPSLVVKKTEEARGG